MWSLQRTGCIEYITNLIDFQWNLEKLKSRLVSTALRKRCRKWRRPVSSDIFSSVRHSNEKRTLPTLVFVHTHPRHQLMKFGKIPWHLVFESIEEAGSGMTPLIYKRVSSHTDTSRRTHRIRAMWFQWKASIFLDALPGTSSTLSSDHQHHCLWLFCPIILTSVIFQSELVSQDRPIHMS